MSLVVHDDQVAESARRQRSWRGVGFYVAAAGTALYMLRLLGASWTTHFPAVWPDAIFAKQGYLAVAAKGPFRPSFYFAFRPIGYPFFLWLFGRSTQLTVVAQTALYCAVVIALCATALRVLRSRVVALVTVVVFVGIAIQAKYAMWSTQILSESLAISLGLAALAVWWRFASAPTPSRARWGWALFAAWMLARDAHVLPGTAVVVPVALGVSWLGLSLDPKVRRTLTRGALVVVVVAAYSYWSASASHRAQLSFHNVVGVRVLPDAQLTKWFAGHGMPLDDALRTRSGKGGLDDNFYISKDPAFAKYRQWARGRGPRALVLSLVVLAPHYVDLLDKDLPSILPGDLHYYDTQSVYVRMPNQMPLQLGGPSTRKGLTVWLILAASALGASAALARRRKRGFGPVVFGTTVLVLALVELYTTWGGDPVEMQRHLIGALSRLSFGLVIVIASAIDTAIAPGPRPAATSAGDLASEVAVGA